MLYKSWDETVAQTLEEYALRTVTSIGSTNNVVCYNTLFYLQTEQITAEYKVQALQFHPDKNEGNKEAEEKFQKLKVRIV